MTYKIKEINDNKTCYDPSSNDTEPVICKDVSGDNYQLFNIYQSPDNVDNYYLKTTIKEQVCDLSDNNLMYCNLTTPGKNSYFNFTRTGAEKFKINDAVDGKFCKLNSNNNQIECNESQKSEGSNFSIKKTLL